MNGGDGGVGGDDVSHSQCGFLYSARGHFFSYERLNTGMDLDCFIKDGVVNRIHERGLSCRGQDLQLRAFGRLSYSGTIWKQMCIPESELARRPGVLR